MLDGPKSLTVAVLLLAAATTAARLDGTQAQPAEGDPTALEGKQRARPAIVIADLAYYSDDSVALLMLLRSRAVDIVGIVATAGNVCAGQSAKDTQRLLQTAGAGGLPVIEGPSTAWHQARRHYYRNVEKPALPKTAYAGALDTSAECRGEETSAKHDSRAADYLIETARRHAGELVVVLQGPATVLGQALKREARLPSLLAHVYAMGGSLRVPGNVTKAAEFNVWFDPEAMSDLVRAGAAMTLVPLDATDAVTYGGIARAGLKGRGPAAEYLGQYVDYRRSRSRKAPMWDEVLAAVIIDPSVVERSERLRLEVSTQRDPSYGKLSALQRSAAPGQRTIDVITKVDAARVRGMVTRILAGK
jgi:purine nucleosidase